MSRLKNAPFLKEPWNKQYFSDLIILAGSKAWKIWDKGKGEAWRLIVDGLQIDIFNTSNGKSVSPYDRNPIILGDEQLGEILALRIADEEHQFITLIQCGELTKEQKTAICLNIATNTKAKIVTLLSSELERLENWSDYINRLRTDSESRNIAEIAASKPKIKENTPTSDKTRAFKTWLGLDLAMQRSSQKIYAYNGKTWNIKDDDELVESLVAYLDENELSYSERSINTLIGTLKIQLPRMGEPSPDLIAFDNGVLNRNTLLFEPHNRQNWLTACIPHNYDEQATNTPHFDRWLNFVSDGNQDKLKNILAALYAILTNRYNWQVFFQVTGKGGSGKSVFAGIATLLAGDKNTASGRLENFDDERKLAGFEDKKLIICSEQAKYAGDGGGLKAITGGDMVRIDPKHKQPFNTKITALIMIVNNEPCKWTERNGGIDRRIVNYCFDKVMPEKERDPYFMDKITLEIGGIIRKVLDAFSNPEEAKKALEAQKESKEALEIKKQSDPLTDFFGYLYTSEYTDGLYIGSGNTIGQDKVRTHLYPAYLYFTRAKNMLELGLNTFVIGLEQAAKQHGNQYEFTKRKTNKGQRTNVHFKNFEDFKNDILN